MYVRIYICIYIYIFFLCKSSLRGMESSWCGSFTVLTETRAHFLFLLILKVKSYSKVASKAPFIKDVFHAISERKGGEKKKSVCLSLEKYIYTYVSKYFSKNYIYSISLSASLCLSLYIIYYFSDYFPL